MPTFTHGKNAAFKFDDSGGTIRDISNVLTDVAVSRTRMLRSNIFSNSSKAFVSDLKDSTITLTGTFDATVNGYFTGILGSEVDFEFYPIELPEVIQS